MAALGNLSMPNLGMGVAALRANNGCMACSPCLASQPFGMKRKEQGQQVTQGRLAFAPQTRGESQRLALACHYVPFWTHLQSSAGLQLQCNLNIQRFYSCNHASSAMKLACRHAPAGADASVRNSDVHQMGWAPKPYLDDPRSSINNPIYASLVGKRLVLLGLVKHV